MTTLRQFLQRFGSFFRRSELDQDLHAEMSAHLEMAVEENRKLGMSADEARRQALIHFGGTQQATERIATRAAFRFWTSRSRTFATLFVLFARISASLPSQYSSLPSASAQTSSSSAW
jgi:hypothetical protein